MKKYLFAIILVVATTPVLAADVGISVSVGQPGFYGRLDIGSFPQPRLIIPTPVIILPGPPGISHQPVYMRVPPGHQKKWGKHCHKYNACGQPVYFVQDDWYNNEYAPRYRGKHGKRGDKDSDHDDDHGDDKHKNENKGKHGKD